MTAVIHPRPNPIVAAMYTLRDMDVDVIVVHGPSGCGFMASRMLEEADIRVVTSGMRDNDLIFGGSESLAGTLKTVREKFNPKTIAVIGTCASMIIGEDLAATIRKTGIECNVFPVDCHGCMGDNTRGAIKALEAGRDAGIISAEEADRQINLMKASARMEKNVGMASKDYLSPTSGPTKMNVCKKILNALDSGKKVAVVMIAKKELAYRFSDIFPAIDRIRKHVGGHTLFVANLNDSVGLPRIRRYCNDILAELKDADVEIDRIVGGLDEYPIVGEEMRKLVDEFEPDLTVLIGICHAYPNICEDDILITDQPRQLANYLSAGYSNSVGEISSHSMVMSTRKIVHLETADTLRELLEERS